MTIRNSPNKVGDNPEAEASEGIPFYGFQDPTGEFPRKEYWRGSSINKAARGVGKPNDLTVSGTFKQIDLELEETQPSIYPYNQVKETYSGHVIEYDDTAGGERILIKHRSGTGIELRPDGTIYISSVKNSLQTVGKDMKVIVEGDTKLAYKGNVDMWVEGNFNVDVGGDYNIKTKGHKREKIGKNNRKLVSGTNELLVKKSNATKVVGSSVDLCLDNRQIISKGQFDLQGDGNIEMVADDQLILSGGAEAVMVSKTTNISGLHTSILGITGSIGGTGMDFTGKVYQGPAGPIPHFGPVPNPAAAQFFGVLHGQSWISSLSLGAVTAASLGPPAPVYPTPVPPTAPPPLTPIVGAHLLGGNYAIRTVTVDAGGVLKQKILREDEYGGVFDDGEPSTDDLRSAFRDPEVKNKLLGAGVRDGLLSTESLIEIPSKIGRTSGKEPSSFFGMTAIGNSLENLGKRVTRGADLFAKDDQLDAERDRLSTTFTTLGDSA